MFFYRYGSWGRRLGPVKLALSLPHPHPRHPASPPPIHTPSRNLLLTVPRRYFWCGTFCYMFCSVSLTNVFLLTVMFVNYPFRKGFRKGLPTACRLFILGPFNCICLSFPLMLRTWRGSGCISPWVHLFTLSTKPYNGASSSENLRISKTYLYNFDPLKPYFNISKSGVYRGIHYFAYFCPNT